MYILRYNDLGRYRQKLKYLFSFSFKDFLLIMLLQFSQFSPFIPPPSCTPQPSSIPLLSSCPWVVNTSSFEFSVSYTIFSLSPSILCLLIMLLLPCTFPPLFLPSPSPLKSLCVMSISLILFLFWLF